MDAQQFQVHIQAMAQQEQDRRNYQANRDRVKDLIRQTAACDGSSVTAVRTWIREINLALSQVGAHGIVEIVTKTVHGPLRFEVERFIEGAMAANGLARRNIPWDNIRQHVAQQFLNLDEPAALRDEVETLRQSAYEPEVQYARRFRDVADVAYPPPARNPDQERILIKTFLRGLKSADLARRVVTDTNPDTMEEAITATCRLSERNHAFERLRRTEEPMEVGPIVNPKPTTATAKQGTSEGRDLQSLTGTVDKLATKLAKIEASFAQAPRKTTAPKQKKSSWRGKPTGKNVPNYAPDGKPRCFRCNKYGHVRRECRSFSGHQGNGPLS